MSWLPPSLQGWHSTQAAAPRRPAGAPNTNNPSFRSSQPPAHLRRSQPLQASHGGPAARGYSQQAAGRPQQHYAASSVGRSATVAPAYRPPPVLAPTRTPHYQSLTRDAFAARLPQNQSQLNLQRGAAAPPPPPPSFSQGFSIRKRPLVAASSHSLASSASVSEQPETLPRHLSAVPSLLDEETQLSLSNCIPTSRTLPASVVAEASCQQPVVDDDETQDDGHFEGSRTATSNGRAVGSQLPAVSCSAGGKRAREERSQDLVAGVTESAATALATMEAAIADLKKRLEGLEGDLKVVTTSLISTRTELDRERETNAATRNKSEALSEASITALVARHVDTACARVVPRLLSSSILMSRAATVTAAVSSVSHPEQFATHGSGNRGGATAHAPQAPSRIVPVFKTVAPQLPDSSSDTDDGAAY